MNRERITVNDILRQRAQGDEKAARRELESIVYTATPACIRWIPGMTGNQKIFIEAIGNSASLQDVVIQYGEIHDRETWPKWELRPRRHIAIRLLEELGVPNSEQVKS